MVMDLKLRLFLSQFLRKIASFMVFADGSPTTRPRFTSCSSDSQRVVHFFVRVRSCVLVREDKISVSARLWLILNALECTYGSRTSGSDPS